MTAALRDAFGESVPVHYERTGDGTTADFVAIFDFEDANQESGGGVSTNMRRTVLDIRHADLGGEPLPDDYVTVYPAGDTAKANGTRYRIVDTEPDSPSNTKAILRKA